MVILTNSGNCNLTIGIQVVRMTIKGLVLDMADDETVLAIKWCHMAKV